MESTRPIIVVHDVSSDEVVERPMNDEEWSQRLADDAAAAERAASAAAAKVASEAKLAALGFTPDDLKALLG